VTSANATSELLTGWKARRYNGALMAGGRDPLGDAGDGYGTAWSIIGTLLAGLAVWGGIGFLIDRLTGLHAVFLSIGLVVGAVGGVYLVIVRYGREPKK
jgi:F0F1-type ATP synthase assembly protein I